MARKVQETCRERLTCMAFVQKLERQLSSLLFWGPLRGSLQGGTILPVLKPPHTWLILKLLGCEISLPNPVPSWGLAAPSSQIAIGGHCLASSPTLRIPSAEHLLAGSSPQLTWSTCSPHISGETLWRATGAIPSCSIFWVDYWPCRDLRLLQEVLDSALA